jgi:hypothetical protein
MSWTLKCVKHVSESTAAALAIPIALLLPDLMQNCVDARAARVLAHDENFAVLQFQCQQIYYVYDFVTSRLEIPISPSARTRGFSCKRDRIMSALAHGLEAPEMRARHPGLAEDREREILGWIEKCATKSRPITRLNLREHVATEYDVPAKRGWVNSFIRRHIGELCVAKSSPQEAQRLEIPRCFLEQTLAYIAQFVHGRPTELVFNLDQVGISEWEDRKPQKVLVAKSMSDQTVHHKVNRNLRHVLVIACVSAAGESLIPYIVTSQD